MKKEPVISDTVLWDVDTETLSFDDSAEWVILRVFDRGSLQDVKAILDYYGVEKVKNTMVWEEGFLPNHSILLAKAFFQLSFQDFKCLEKKSFHQSFGIS